MAQPTIADSLLHQFVDEVMQTLRSDQLQIVKLPRYYHLPEVFP